jgi:hypothetical protein
MIITAILNLVYIFIGFILSPLNAMGDVVLDTNFSTAISTASGYFHSLNAIIPIDTMIQILGVSLTIEGAYLLFKVIMWIIAKIPMLN